MSNITISTIEEQILKGKQDLKELEEKLKEAKEQSPDHQLATELHSMLCTWNHTDGCCYFYEFKNGKDDWNGSAHGAYLKKAQKLICMCDQKGMSVDSALEIFKLVKGI